MLISDSDDKNIRLWINESENQNNFNYTQNPSATVAGSTGSYIDAITGSDFHPYTTTVGLYNDLNELIAVAKLSRPTRKDFTNELLIRVRLDF